MSFFTLPPQVILQIIPLISIFYLFSLIVYRLFLSPLKAYPGPKLAAITSWYRIYYDVYKGGDFVSHLQELHNKYGKYFMEMACHRANRDVGPILRIGPNEAGYARSSGVIAS